MDSILDRIALIANKEGISLNALEKKIGASQYLLYRALKDGTGINVKWVQAILHSYPHYSAEWLLIGEGEMLKNKDGQESPLLNHDKNRVLELENEIKCLQKMNNTLFKTLDQLNELRAENSRLYESLKKEETNQLVTCYSTEKVDGGYSKSPSHGDDTPTINSHNHANRKSTRKV
jgi:hypothetical protein